MNKQTMKKTALKTALMTLFSVTVCLVLLFSFQTCTGKAKEQTFKKTEVMISMRDGTKLHTEIFAPEAAQGPLPFLLLRTPYGIASDEKGHPLLRTSGKDLGG